MKKTDGTFLNRISKYAKRKTCIIVISLLLATITLLFGGIFTILQVLKITNISLTLTLYLVFIVGLVILIIAITHYEKERKKLIDEFGIKSLGEFFYYFNNVKKKDYIYYEVKDIFMYGLWKLKDENPYLKLMSEDEEYRFVADDIREKGITKKEILATSIFRCLTFKKEGFVYRNQKIFLDQNKFIKILNEYSEIYQDNNNHRDDYIEMCNKIEETYRADKEVAKANYNGLSKEIGRWERFVVFSNKPNAVMGLKKLLIVFAIISMILLNLVYFKIVPEKYERELNFYITCVFNLITIVLLLVDIAKKDEKDLLHM